MKHKKLLILVTVLFFVTVLIICLSSLFKVVDVSVNAVSVVGSNEKVLENTENALSKFSGKNLLFLTEKEVASSVESKSPYIKVTKVKKEFPNKISVFVTERIESFVILYENEYYVLDSEFVCVAKKQENVSNIAGKRNLIINANLADFSVNALQVGKTFAFNDGVTNNYFLSLASTLSTYGENLISVAVKVKESSYYNRQLSLRFIEGVNITLDKASENTLEKLNFAYDYYLALADKSTGEYVVSVNAETGEFIVS